MLYDKPPWQHKVIVLLRSAIFATIACLLSLPFERDFAFMIMFLGFCSIWIVYLGPNVHYWRKQSRIGEMWLIDVKHIYPLSCRELVQQEVGEKTILRGFIIELADNGRTFDYRIALVDQQILFPCNSLALKQRTDFEVTELLCSRNKFLREHALRHLPTLSQVDVA